MDGALLCTILIISVSSTALIIPLLCLSPYLAERFGSQKMYFVWLIIAVRLIVPLRFELPSAPIEIKFPERVVVMRTNAPSPIEIMTEDERAEAAVHEASSFNYAPLMTLTELLTLIWAAGASIFFLLHILKYICFRLSVKPYLKNTNEKDVKLCGRLSSPVAAGFFRPAVLLPDIDFGAEELSMILLHERTHIKRGDLWYKLLLTAANAVHWFNPAVYFMVRRASRDLEYSCDCYVVKGKDAEFRKQYSKTILKYARGNAE